MARLRWPGRIIGPEDNPYMLRWHLLRIGKLPRVYVHKFVRSDEDRALHDHPWSFVSVLLKGSYNELVPGGLVRRRAPSVAYRSIAARHRVILDVDESGRPIPVWTLFFTGLERRRWGFWCPSGWVDARDFGDDGCGE